MLIGNGVRLASNPQRLLGGANAHSVNRANWGWLGARNNAQMEAALAKSGEPNGYRHPASWIPPMKPGGLSAYNTIAASGDILPVNLAGGLNGAADLAGAGDITAANLALVVSAVAALVGSGDITADITGKLEAAADLAGSGDIVAALGALAELVASLTGSGDASGTALGKAYMSADIVVTGELLNTANVAAAVWEAVAGAYNSAGSMGEKLNDAGSASNPWTEIIESGYTAAEILRLIAAAAAGKVSINGTTGDVTIRDLADTKNRIVAETTPDGERTSVARDVT